MIYSVIMDSMYWLSQRLGMRGHLQLYRPAVQLLSRPNRCLPRRRQWTILLTMEALPVSHIVD